MTRPTLLFFSRDPGPTNVMIAVYEMLSDPANCTNIEFQGFAAQVVPEGTADFVIFAKGKAIDAWHRAGHRARDWDTVRSTATDRDASLVDLLRRRAVTAVITGTSDVDEDTDRALWRAAHACAIPSHVFLDHRANLHRRFTDRDGTLTYPDAVYVPGAAYRDDLIGAGFPAPRLHIVGDLQFARMRRMGQRESAADIAALRARWRSASGVAAEGAVVLFASECSAEMALLGRPSPYSEFATLDQLIAGIRARVPVGGRPLSPDRTLVVIRPHPRDAARKYDAYAALPASPTVIVSSDGTPAQAILAADLVVGMDSTLLFEADALGQAVVSLVASSSFSQYVQGKAAPGE